jgi:TPR repeat protein
MDDESFDEILQRAKSGSTPYSIQLGHAYLTGTEIGGRQVLQDFGEAMKWFRVAHEKGAFTATYLLGTMYEEGKGIASDVPQAITLYEQAAQRGGYLPCVRLARIYAAGKGVPQSRERAASWYEKVLSFEGKVDEEGEMKEARAFLKR